jgi:ABC-type glycerol-3-phosphate transport system permease component
LYTASFIVVSVSLTLCAAYPLSRPDLKGRKFFTLLFTFTMIFSGGLIPTYLLVRGLGFLNTPLALLIPNAVGVWNVIVARTFFQSSIPGELLEAAEIEGASDGQIFFKVVMPLSTSIIAVLGLFYAVYQWNGYFEAMIYIRSQHLYPLQIILRNILIANMVDSSMIMDVEEFAMREALKEQLKFSLIVVASAPVLALYPFVQRHFVKGIMIGSLKG